MLRLISCVPRKHLWMSFKMVGNVHDDQKHPLYEPYIKVLLTRGKTNKSLVFISGNVGVPGTSSGRVILGYKSLLQFESCPQIDEVSLLY